MNFTIVIPIKPWPNGLTSQSKFAKPELVYGLAKGGLTDSQVGSQVAKSHKFHAYHWLMCFYNNRLLAINLCWLALGGQTVKNLHLLASKFELNQSQRKSMQVVASRYKSTQVGGQTKHKLNASPKLVSTCESVWPGLYGSKASFSFQLCLITSTVQRHSAWQQIFCWVGIWLNDSDLLFYIFLMDVGRIHLLTFECDFSFQVWH